MEWPAPHIPTLSGKEECAGCTPETNLGTFPHLISAQKNRRQNLHPQFLRYFEIQNELLINAHLGNLCPADYLAQRAAQYIRMSTDMDQPRLRLCGLKWLCALT
jgi:hypothetical protein